MLKFNIMLLNNLNTVIRTQWKTGPFKGRIFKDGTESELVDLSVINSKNICMRLCPGIPH